MDTITREQRSAAMARIGRANTAPELAVRRAAHRLGYRFRLHRRDLPGTPDLVFPRLRTALFVNGCFWHRHEGCRYATTPSTRTDFWLAKFARNTARDSRVADALTAMNWGVRTIWECECREPQLSERLRQFLG